MGEVFSEILLYLPQMGSHALIPYSPRLQTILAPKEPSSFTLPMEIKGMSEGSVCFPR